MADFQPNRKNLFKMSNFTKKKDQLSCVSISHYIVYLMFCQFVLVNKLYD